MVGHARMWIKVREGNPHWCPQLATRFELETTRGPGPCCTIDAILRHAQGNRRLSSLYFPWEVVVGSGMVHG